MTTSSLLRKMVAVVLFLFGNANFAFTQNYKPAAEYQSLLNLRFYEANGGFLVENVQLVFPPVSMQSAELVISQVNGAGEWKVPLRYEAYPQFPAFGNLLSAGGPGGITINQAGAFMMTVKVGGSVITQMPFSMKLEQGNDPFNPQKRYVREGAWRELAFIAVPMDDSTPNVTFNFLAKYARVAGGHDKPKGECSPAAGRTGDRGNAVATNSQLHRLVVLHQGIGNAGRARARFATLPDHGRPQARRRLYRRTQGQRPTN
jgi:hypothetical protein